MTVTPTAGDVLDLRTLIERIGRTYDRRLGMSSEAQQLLRRAGNEVSRWVPGGYQAAGSGGKGNGASVPWIAVFDPDETTSAQHGMYVVYLFAEDLQTVALSLNQGVTELVEQIGGRRARERLKIQAEAIRRGFDVGWISDLDVEIDLQSKHAMPVYYEHGNIVARTYRLGALPPNDEMVEDLRGLLRLFEDAVEVRESLRRTQRDVIATVAENRTESKPQRSEFKPKNDTEYLQIITARVIEKSRKHETLVRQYGEYLLAKGYEVNTNCHPRDLTADAPDGRHWLVEAKMVRHGNGHAAAREAVGQLLFYGYIHYTPGENIGRLALFSESVGDLFVGLLETLGMAAVWKVPNGWAGSSTARRAGLC
jgi:hypothetical protein